MAEVGARGVHAHGHVSISSNMWHAPEWLRRNVILGSFWAESGPRPKVKFDGLLMLFIFYLGCLATRAIC
jgi:hypothetical protein